MSFQNNPLFINNVPCTWMHPSYNLNVVQSFPSIQKEDEKFVNKWFSNLPSKSQTKNISGEVCIPEIRKSLVTVINNCGKIRNLESELRKNVVNLSEPEWEGNMNKIANWKKEISESVLENQNVYNEVKKKIQRRTKKRDRLKRQRNERKLKKIEEKKSAEIERKQIDVNIKKMEEELGKEKKDEEFKAMVDNVVRDVNKRKTTARRYISLLDSLIKLRHAREKSASGRAERIDPQASQEFSYNIGKLKELWEFALNEYLREENDLRKKLNETKDGTSTSLLEPVSKVDIEKDMKQWKLTLFGDEDLVPQRDFQHIYQFISVRGQWDQYISSSSDATSLPVGWVAPPDRAAEGWIPYHQQKTE